ncbi:unnamed protein product [Arctia plantaginis]|uniref:Nanos-type domain-containing protein n=1 Tax=Arctia plantaginis TaxID=874455 RepID=A0A8S1AH10_ARCPL|nr:unnamed protein product [Arctia plantaginis]
MYPTKSMNEYMSEINRLFPRSTENDIYRTPNPSITNMHSPFPQSTSINRSSSSADSASSESFPDMSQQSDRYKPSEHSFDTPFVIRRQRPIVGRKIFDNPDRLAPMLEPIPQKPFEEEIPNTIWQSEDHHLFSQTPPNRVEQNNCNRNVFYELFPTEQKGFEFRTPISPRSPASNYTGSIGNSPIFSPTVSNISPNSGKVTLPRMPTPPAFHRSSSFASSSRYDVKTPKMCTFCRKNGETPVVYMTHTVKEKVGNHNIVTCPILRSHVCSTCGASGDNAHTITYCPVLRVNNNGQPLQSTTITLKNTRIKSNGRRRY